MPNDDFIQSMRGSVRPPRRRGGLVDLVLVAASVVGVAGLAWFAVGRYLLIPPVARVAVVATPGLPWTADDEKRCKASASAAADAPLPGELALANTAVTEGFAGLATMLHCRLAIKTTRFCNPAEKAALVAMVEDYLSRADLVVAGLALQGAPMEMASSMFGGETTAGRDIYNMQKDATIAFMTPFHERIRTDLRSMAASGVITATDFGGFMGMGASPRIAKMLAGVTAKGGACA